jgi:predicted DNA-binding protein
MPDETFERASRQATALGMSRSEFFARAAERYLDELDAQSLTGQIDDALERMGGASDESVSAAVAHGRTVLSEVDDEW